MGLGLGSSLSSPVYSQSEYAVTRSVDLDGTNQHIIITNSVADDIKNIGSVIDDLHTSGEEKAEAKQK